LKPLAPPYLAVPIFIPTAVDDYPGSLWLLGGWYELSGPDVPQSIYTSFDEAINAVFRRGLPGETYDILQRGPAAESFVPVRRVVAWREPGGPIVAWRAALPAREGSVLRGTD
jgi:hypothetical protein